MPKVSERHLRQLRPYLIGEQPRPNGEIDMYCPLHEDTKRSASLNVLTGQWYCFAGCGGGGIIDLMRAQGRWVSPDAAAVNGNGGVRRSSDDGERMELNMAMIEGWHSSLLSDESALDDLVTKRGITSKTVIDFKLGYDRGRRVYTIPVFGEGGPSSGEIWNVRFYNMYPPEGKRKIWSAKGWRVCELYPIWLLPEWEEVIVDEGEWDTLLNIQNGYGCVTRTASASTWRIEWGQHFKGKRIYVGHDCDTEGENADRKVGRALHRVGDVRTIKLPFERVEKHGPDWTDFWFNYDRSDMERLRAEAEPWGQKESKDPEVITVLDAFDSLRVGDPVKLQVTIKGKKEPGYSIPRKAKLACTRDAGAKCQICPLNPAGGEATIEIEPQNSAILGLIDEGVTRLTTYLAAEYGVPGGKCGRLEIEVTEHQAVEVLFARPSIDHSDGTQARDYKNIRITNVGRHDTEANNTVVVTGALYPSPKDQRNEFLSWEIQKQETSVDRFEMTPEAIKLMKRFQPRKGQRPLQKLGQIDRELAAHVTRIVGRPQMHAVMDLTFHVLLDILVREKSSEERQLLLLVWLAACNKSAGKTGLLLGALSRLTTGESLSSMSFPVLAPKTLERCPMCGRQGWPD
jgi:hypothetical protein